MRKIPKSKNKFTPKPFIDNGILKLIVREEDGRFVEFIVMYKGQEKRFPVKNFKILDAWKQVERFVEDLK